MEEFGSSANQAYVIGRTRVGTPSYSRKLPSNSGTVPAHCHSARGNRLRWRGAGCHSMSPSVPARTQAPERKLHLAQPEAEEVAQTIAFPIQHHLCSGHPERVRNVYPGPGSAG